MSETIKNLVNTDEIAIILMRSERRIQQLAKDGTLKFMSERPYKFELIPAIQDYIRYLDSIISGKDKKDSNTELKRLTAEADLKRSKADMAELQLSEFEGKMHRSEDVEFAVTDLVFAIKSMIMALPGRLALDVKVAKTAAEISVIIRNECNKILEELSEYKYDPKIYEKRVREREGWSEVIADESD